MGVDHWNILQLLGFQALSIVSGYWVPTLIPLLQYCLLIPYGRMVDDGQKVDGGGPLEFRMKSNKLMTQILNVVQNRSRNCRSWNMVWLDIKTWWAITSCHSEDTLLNPFFGVVMSQKMMKNCYPSTIGLLTCCFRTWHQSNVVVSSCKLRHTSGANATPTAGYDYSWSIAHDSMIEFWEFKSIA